MTTTKLDKSLSVRDEFPVASDADWQEAARKLLKGKPIESLQRKTVDSLTIDPLYTQLPEGQDSRTGMPGQAPYIRGGAALEKAQAWRVCRMYETGQEDTAAAIQKDLGRGLTAAWLQGKTADIKDTLNKIQTAENWSATTLLLDANLEPAINYDVLAPIQSELAELSGAVYADPYALRADLGESAAPFAEQLSTIADAINAYAKDAPQFGLISVSLAPYHNAGAGMALELGIFVATVQEYLNALEAEGIDLETAAAAFEVIVPVGRDTFQEIAKLRALRGLWTYLLQQAEMKNIPAVRINGVASQRTLTVRDPWVNMLRGTAETFSAALGGADIITSRHFGEAAGSTNELGQRMALNTQLILQEESHLGFVADAAGGSYYLETLTNQLMFAGWTAAQQLEAAGGVGAMLEDGTLAAQIAEQAAERQTAINKRKAAIIGVSNYPNLSERTLEDATTAQHDRPKGALPVLRDADVFETLRQAADDYAAAKGNRPSIFLANLGKIPQHKARASFATNLFEAGGIEALQNEGFADRDACVAAFKKSGAKIAVICGTDDLYAEEAETIAKQLKTAGAEQIWLAGRPGDQQQAFADAGIQRAIYVGCDVIVELNAALDVYGVAQ